MIVRPLPSFAWMLMPLLVVAAVLSACGGSGQPGAPTPEDGSILVEQGTVANLGGYRMGVVRVSPDDRTAVIRIWKPDEAPFADATLAVGEPLRIAGGLLYLVEVRAGGGGRDTVRLRFEPE